MTDLAFVYYASDTFASRAQVLVDSIKKHHKHAKIVHVNPGDGPLGSYIPGMAKQRLITALELLEQGYDKVVIIGADCELFAPLRSMLNRLTLYNMVIVPHVTSPVESKDYMAQLYRTGHANADLIAFRQSETSKNTLRWLISVTEGNEPEKSIFYEQTWLSAVPFLFNGVIILRDPTYNYGYWRDREEKVSFIEGRWWLDKKPITMVQYSGYQKGLPHKISRYYNGIEASGDLLRLYKEYDDRIIS